MGVFYFSQTHTLTKRTLRWQLLTAQWTADHHHHHGLINKTTTTALHWQDIIIILCINITWEQSTEQQNTHNSCFELVVAYFNQHVTIIYPCLKDINFIFLQSIKGGDDFRIFCNCCCSCRPFDASDHWTLKPTAETKRM